MLSFRQPLFVGTSRATLPQRRALLRVVATAAEERLPLAALVGAWAQDERSRQRHRLQKLAKLLQNGTALPDALERVPRLLSDEEMLMVRFASESGSFASTLRSRLDETDLSDEKTPSSLRWALQYALIFLVLAMPISVYLNAAVAPSFEQINADFSIEEPFTSQLAQTVTRIASFVWIGGAIVLLLWLWSRFFDWPVATLRRVILPRILRPLRERRVAAVLRRLGENANAGRPLAGAIATLARYHYDPGLRHRLLFARNELSLGAELWPALTSTGFLTLEESSALTAADQVGTRGWTLRTLADVRERKAQTRLARQSTAVASIVLLIFAALVVTQALYMFGFLTNLINALA